MEEAVRLLEPEHGLEKRTAGQVLVMMQGSHGGIDEKVMVMSWQSSRWQLEVVRAEKKRGSMASLLVN
ncbi:hypothetical protein M0R45_016127 [Rubus argutus]|uniref:Uncharacterized protein n=1 Tax=Rubus argutus TaxID=59490 RepID=A0AAW1XT04_RUBAR